MAPYLKNVSECVLNTATNTMIIKEMNCYRKGPSLILRDKGAFLQITNVKYIRSLSREDRESTTVRIKLSH
jgi:hypothetical protein